MMPELDGFQVLQQLSEAGRLTDLPVIMISAVDEVQGVARCIELGTEDYLTKPFDSVLLRARIGACLEKKHLRDEERRRAQELKNAPLQVEDEKRRSEALLLNILPAKISEETARAREGDPEIFRRRDNRLHPISWDL
jgi:adenylate cyclase